MQNKRTNELGGGDIPLQLVVIIPTYRRPASLPGVVASVKEQSYPNIKILISDDASRDETATVCERLIVENPDLRIEYRCNNENKGEYRNVNIALGLCRDAKYVAVLQDDTRYLDSEFLSTAVSLMEEHLDVSFVAGHWRDETKEYRHWDKNLIVDGVKFWSLWPGCWCLWPACLFRWDSLAEVGFLDTSVISRGDSLMLLKAALIGKVILLDRLVLEDGYKKIEGSYDEFYRKKKSALFFNTEYYFRSAMNFAIQCGVREEEARNWYKNIMSNEAIAYIAKCMENESEYDEAILDIMNFCITPQILGDGLKKALIKSSQKQRE